MTFRQVALIGIALALALAVLAPFRDSLNIKFPWETTNTIVSPYRGDVQEGVPIDRRITAHRIAANRKKYEGVHVLFHCAVINAPGDGTATANCGTSGETPMLFSLRGDVDSLSGDERVLIDGIIENPVGSGAQDGPPSISVLNVR